MSTSDSRLPEDVDLDDLLWAAAAGADKRGCPRRHEIALAVINGPFALSAEQEHHVLDEQCDYCEGQFADAFSDRCPNWQLLAMVDAWPETSPLGAALRHHAETCSQPECVAAAVGMTAAEPVREVRGVADAVKRFVLRLLPEATSGAPLPALNAGPGTSGQVPDVPVSSEFGRRRRITLGSAAEGPTVVFVFTRSTRAITVELTGASEALVGRRLVLELPSHATSDAPEMDWSGRPGRVELGEVPATGAVAATLGTLRWPPRTEARLLPLLAGGTIRSAEADPEVVIELDVDDGGLA